LLDRQKRHAEAVPVFEEAIRLDPHDAVTYNDLGCTLMDLGRVREAAVAFQESVRLDASSTLAQTNLRVARGKLY
jgi:Flp pilus assembly protein TadD